MCNLLPCICNQSYVPITSYLHIMFISVYYTDYAEETHTDGGKCLFTLKFNMNYDHYRH